MKDTMFSGPRYATRGVAHDVPLDIQLLLWSLIDAKKKGIGAIDYLQIFELSVVITSGKNLQKIIHRQEQPEYLQEHIYCTVSAPMDCKVWAIDDGTYSTMLFPDEY